MWCAENHKENMVQSTLMGMFAFSILLTGPYAEIETGEGEDGYMDSDKYCCYDNSAIALEYDLFITDSLIASSGFRFTEYYYSEDINKKGEVYDEDTHFLLGLGYCLCNWFHDPHGSFKIDLNGGTQLRIGYANVTFSQITLRKKGMDHKGYGFGFYMPF